MAIISNAVTIADAGAFSVDLGALTLIKTITISSSTSTVAFSHGSSSVVFDSTYDTYIFKYINMHPATDATELQFQVSVNGGSSYGVAITSTAFQAYHIEGDNSQGVAYYTADDLAQGTGFQNLCNNVGNGNDESMSGTLYLFNPSSTTFVKHFTARSNCYNANDYSQDFYAAGYFNTTSAIDAIQFKMVSGNIDAGTIKLYGIK